MSERTYCDLCEWNGLVNSEFTHIQNKYNGCDVFHTESKIELVLYRCHICWRQIVKRDIYKTTRPDRKDKACFNFCSKKCFEKPHNIETSYI